MSFIKNWLARIAVKRVVAQIVQIIAAFVASHAMGAQAIGLSVNLDPQALELALMAGWASLIEWGRHKLAERYPDNKWL